MLPRDSTSWISMFLRFYVTTSFLYEARSVQSISMWPCIIRLSHLLVCSPIQQDIVSNFRTRLVHADMAFSIHALNCIYYTDLREKLTKKIGSVVQCEWTADLTGWLLNNLRKVHVKSSPHIGKVQKCRPKVEEKDIHAGIISKLWN